MRVAAAVGDVGPSGFARSSSSSSSISYGDSGDELAAAAISAVTAASETPADVVRTVMEAVRSINAPYALHGAEVAIRYCSPTNRASQLTPAAFARYLAEPWYQILTEWDEIEFEDEDIESNKASQDVLVKRGGDDSWTIVNYQLSRHNGRWLMDSMTITE